MSGPVIYFFLPEDFPTILCLFTTSLHFLQFLSYAILTLIFDYKIITGREDENE
ncbi:hypothetical protein PB1_10999 [Bacillus methanolicus PB1]|uniref:Uncharacterized protein n=1 Tax=Bacillus methanolicus PB1 TaxID=997296 RepID=I3DV11_BACMT|nr:hypothetical protein PB1_10999 [Bacillus methanolicus PB1]